MRTIRTFYPLEVTNLQRSYMGYKDIMQHYKVSRATAYRYLAKAPSECKIKLLRHKQKPVILCMIPAIERVHKTARPGNPNIRQKALDKNPT